jgi:hypothetical protein
MTSIRLPKRWLAAGAIMLGVALPTGELLAQPPLPPVPPVAGVESPIIPATPAAAPQPAAPSSGFGRLRSLWTGRNNTNSASPYGATPNASSSNPYGATPSASPLPIGNPSEPPIAEQIALPMEQPTGPAYPVAPGIPPVAQPTPTGNALVRRARPRTRHRTAAGSGPGPGGGQPADPRWVRVWSGARSPGGAVRRGTTRAAAPARVLQPSVRPLVRRGPSRHQSGGGRAPQHSSGTLGSGRGTAARLPRRFSPACPPLG